MKRDRYRTIGLAAWVIAVACPAGDAFAAVSITPGSTFSVASQSGIPAVGTHFHSDHIGALGNPPDKAEVGSLIGQGGSMEECRGLSEFSLSGLSSGTASIHFTLFQMGGLFSGQNSFPFTGNIGVVAYAANNADDIVDYSAASIGLIGTFSTAGLSLGSPISFDVTSLYNAQLLAGSPALGIRLQTTPLTVTGGGALTFDSFTLNVSVPEPTSIALLLAGSGLLLVRRRSEQCSARFCR